MANFFTFFFYIKIKIPAVGIQTIHTYININIRKLDWVSPLVGIPPITNSTTWLNILVCNPPLVIVIPSEQIIQFLFFL